jgi:hypothetical protein
MQVAVRHILHPSSMALLKTMRIRVLIDPAAPECDKIGPGGRRYCAEYRQVAA